jgi:hypothetical protein
MSHICIIRRNGVGSWARCATRKDAIRDAAHLFKLDFQKLLPLKRGQEIDATLIDANGYDDISWGDEYLFANDDGSRGKIPADRIENITVKLP